MSHDFSQGLGGHAGGLALLGMEWGGTGAHILSSPGDFVVGTLPTDNRLGHRVCLMVSVLSLALGTVVRRGC